MTPVLVERMGGMDKLNETSAKVQEAAEEVALKKMLEVTEQSNESAQEVKEAEEKLREAVKEEIEAEEEQEMENVAMQDKELGTENVETEAEIKNAQLETEKKLEEIKNEVEKNAELKTTTESLVALKEKETRNELEKELEKQEEVGNNGETDHQWELTEKKPKVEASQKKCKEKTVITIERPASKEQSQPKAFLLLPVYKK
jgi:hypothetical protein